jgi:heterodisulfide reductase subunit C/energy-converting hydrogenase Eha subunit A
MSNRIDTGLLLELKEYGDINVEACFNCGNCTAICPLSTDETPFPRNNIRLLQLGLKDRLLQSLDPWLCYYCGDCSATCPRGAEPGEAQMTLRRWLTAQYDLAGLSGRFYTSRIWTYGAVLLAMAFVVAMFALFHGPIVTDHVEINTFAPAHVIHMLDWIVAAIIVLFVLSGVFRMYSLVMRQGMTTKIPWWLYITEAWNLPYHFATQKRWLSCTADEKEEKLGKVLPWLSHALLVSGYVTMFVMIVAFLPWFQSDELRPIFHPQRVLGYYATIVLIYGGGRALWGRITKTEEYHRFSQASDWLLPGLIVGLAATGILISIFKYYGLPLAVYYAYVAHLAVMMSLYVSIGPMGKWAHLYYRPLAVYFHAVRQKALARQAARAELAPAAP